MKTLKGWDEIFRGWDENFKRWDENFKGSGMKTLVSTQLLYHNNKFFAKIFLELITVFQEIEPPFLKKWRGVSFLECNILYVICLQNL